MNEEHKRVLYNAAKILKDEGPDIPVDDLVRLIVGWSTLSPGTTRTVRDILLRERQPVPIGECYGRCGKPLKDKQWCAQCAPDHQARYEYSQALGLCLCFRKPSRFPVECELAPTDPLVLGVLLELSNWRCSHCSSPRGPRYARSEDGRHFILCIECALKHRCYGRCDCKRSYKTTNRRRVCMDCYPRYSRSIRRNPDVVRQRGPCAACGKSPGQWHHVEFIAEKVGDPWGPGLLLCQECHADLHAQAKRYDARPDGDWKSTGHGLILSKTHGPPPAFLEAPIGYTRAWIAYAFHRKP